MEIFAISKRQMFFRKAVSGTVSNYSLAQSELINGGKTSNILSTFYNPIVILVALFTGKE